MRFDNKDHYPPPYKRVFIEYYPTSSDKYAIAKGWYTIDDYGNNRWVLIDTKEVIEDKQVVNWTDFENKVII